MELNNADLVKALRCCARYAYNCEGCVALPVCDAQDYFGVELIAADRIEQLEIELENTRRCLGDLRKDLRKDLQDREDLIDALSSDLDSVTRDGNPFEAIMLREKWGFNK